MSTDFTPAYLQAQPCPETCKIVDTDAPDGYVIINASDFDASTMTLYGAEAKPKRAPKADA
jgi:hypothetical protein